MMDKQRPAHHRAREFGSRIGRFAHILTPYVSTHPALVSHAHMQDSRVPPVGLVSRAPDHRVAQRTFAPAASTPPVITCNSAGQHGPICLHALVCHLQSKAVQSHERTQVRAVKGNIRHVEVFQMDGVGISIIERPRPSPGHDTPAPRTTPTPSNAKSPV